jgi:uncharacterized protein YlzI (FlbEa/FlbD family)
MAERFIVLSRLDGSPVWIVVYKIERIHDDVDDDRSGAVIHFDSGKYISVREPPSIVVHAIQKAMVP